MSDLEVVMKNCFGGVDIAKDLLRTWPYLNIETQLFSNVVEGEWDSNGLENPEYRKKVGKLWAEAFRKNKYTDFFDHATTICPYLHHLTVDSTHTQSSRSQPSTNCFSSSGQSSSRRLPLCSA